MAPIALVGAEVSRAQYVMGTLLRVTLRGDSAAHLDQFIDEVFGEARFWDHRLSTYLEDSEVSRINANAPEAIHVSSSTVWAVVRALEWAEKTNGAFDPTVGPLVRLWGFDGTGGRRPEASEVKAVRSRVGWKRVHADRDKSQVSLDQSGMELDFGGIGKGLALDRALARVLGGPDGRTLEEIVLDFGGQLVFWSRHSRVWRTAIRHPQGDDQTVSPLKVKKNGSLATTALSEKFFVAADPKDGKGGLPRRYGHVLDPRTGYPVGRSAPFAGLRGHATPQGDDGSVESVTVWSESAEEADALSTALFVMGTYEGHQYAQKHEVAALFVELDPSQGLRYAATPEWERIFRETK